MLRFKHIYGGQRKAFLIKTNGGMYCHRQERNFANKEKDGSYIFLHQHAGSGSDRQRIRRVLILPFGINADKDLAYLKKGVADMLASRLALKDRVVIVRSTDSSLMAAEIPEPIDAATAAALGAQSRADYVLFGSLTVLGDNVSTDARFFDVRQNQAVLNFSEVGNTQGEIISHINLLAVRIKEEVFGRKTIAARPPPQQSTATQESGPVSRQHPEKLLDKEAGVGFDDSEDSSSAAEVKWKGP